MSTPVPSRKYERVICTGGITENDEWRRLWSITPKLKSSHKIHRWDIIEVKTKKTINHRIETRKIDEKSIKNIGSIPKKDQKNILERIANTSLDDIINSGRSIGILKPNIKKLKLIPSITNEERSFGKFFPKYYFKCEVPCTMCEQNNFYHKMKCRDWGSNILCRKVKNKSDGKVIVRQKLFFDMKSKYNTYFGIGTHHRWKNWMIVGLFWLKR